MIKVFAYQQGKQKDIGWHAEMPLVRKPKIRCVKIIDGLRFYLGWNRKLYVADLFDNYWAGGRATI